MKQVKTVILGSGYFAFGYSEKHADTLIVERSQLTDRHFAGTFRPLTMNACEPKSKGAHDFLAIAREYGLISENAVATPMLECVLSELYCRKDISPLLYTDVISITPSEKGYLLKLYNTGGLTEILAEQIIDTRCHRPDTVRALVYAPRDFTISNQNKGMQLSKLTSFYQNEYTVSLTLDEFPGINEAKCELDKQLTPYAEQGVQILSFAYGADAAHTETPRAVSSAFVLIPEGTFRHPVEAINFGSSFDFSREECYAALLSE